MIRDVEERFSTVLVVMSRSLLRVTRTDRFFYFSALGRQMDSRESGLTIAILCAGTTEPPAAIAVPLS
jgi:hypothetical protein